ncbi:MAG: sulfatase [Fuerstiella sp.]
MTRLRCLFFTVLILSGGFTFADDDRPNIVWLVSEDNSANYLKLYDANGAATPAIEALARQGIVFDHAFANAPVCSVARTTLATGCYGPRIGTQFHRKSVPVPLPEGVRMFPQLLREAGYYTANNNKTDYNAIAGPDVWDDSSKRATWRKRAAGQPFFYMQSFPVSHESSLHFSRGQMAEQKTKTDPATVAVAPYHPDTPTFRYTNARYRDRIMQMDQQIGTIVQQLEKDGLLKNTFIFYFGDHGGVLPRGKGYAYESGLHVPLVVRLPERCRDRINLKPGSRESSFVSFVDFGPTVLELAGVSVPEQMDGRPFPAFRQERSPSTTADAAFGYADRFDEKYDLVRSVRVGRFKYIRNFQPFNFDGLQNNYRYRMLAYEEWRKLFEDGKLNDVQSQFFTARPPEQLFDLSQDPHETRNLALDPQHRKTLLQLRERLISWMKSMPDLSMYPESVLAEKAFQNPVQFGQQHQQQIAELIDTANLSLQPFEISRADLLAALKDNSAWQRYWALIACSSFGVDAREMVPLAKQLAAKDPNRLVRVRAAEFLALLGEQDPSSVLKQALAESESGIEAGLILNTWTLLRDGSPGYELPLNRDDLKTDLLKNDTVARRLEYLSPPSGK